MNYAESGDENDDDEEDFEPVKPLKTRGRALKRRKTIVHDEDDFSDHSDVDIVDEGKCPLSRSEVASPIANI